MAIKHTAPRFVRFLHVTSMVASLLVIASCGGGGGGGGDTGGTTTTTTTTTTTVSGKVTISSSLSTAGKPLSARMKAIAHTPKMKPVGRSFKVASKPVNSSLTSLPGFAAGDAVANAYVYLYDANHPEWLSPVAEGTTDASGNYSLSVLANASTNGNAYTDGNPLPVSNYTMLVYKPSTFDPIAGITTDPVVAVMEVVKEFTGAITGNDLSVEPSDVTPRVQTMLGARKNTDGTYTWGSTVRELANNQKVQVSFDMAMSRGSVQNITVDVDGSSVAGKWALSADWLTATFQPDATLPTGVITVLVPSTIINVYGNALGYDAEGTATVVAGDLTAPTVNFSIANGASGVKLTEPLRLSSTELLDINTLRLQATPTVGALPGVLFVGESGGQFVYEFDLAESLQLNASYSYTVSGIQDLAGNSAADVTGSFSTEASTTGVDGGADTATQSAQAEIVEVFGQWTRAMTEGNLTLMQGLMTGDFIFEYDVNQELMQEDFNRDGRLSAKEFAALMENAFLQWESCGTTIVGDVVGTINVVNEAADFEFSFANTTSTVSSQECSQTIPDDAFYATLKKINGKWNISRLSQTIDTRNKEIVVRDVIELTMTDQNGDEVLKGGVLPRLITNTDQVNFSWDHETGVTSYIILFANSRDPRQLGMAVVMDANTIVENNAVSLDLPQTTQSGFPNGAVNITKLLFDNEFGSNGEGVDIGFDRPGEEIEYEVIGLGSKAASDFLPDQNGNFTITGSQLVRDIVSISPVKRFKNPGDRKDITVNVAADATNATAMNYIPFSEYIDGYDVVASDVVHLTITSSNKNTNGSIWLGSSNGWNEIPVTFDANGVGTFTMSGAMNPNACKTGVTPAANEVCLFEGWNWIDIWDGYDLYRSFSVRTTGGIPPAITATVNDGTQDLVFSFDYAQAASNTSAVTITGAIDTTAHPEFTSMTNFYVNAWIWNNAGIQTQAQGTYDIATHTFDFGSVPIYTGDNWINISIWADDGAGNYADANTHFGVYTDNSSSVYVPPFGQITVTTTEGSASNTGDWGSSSDWDASGVTVGTDQVTISGVMQGTGGMYWVSSDGIYSEGQLSPSAGNFSVTITLYQGWNWISFDDMQGGWYGLNIYSSNGKQVPKPTVTAVNGATVNGATVNGTTVVDDGFGGPVSATTSSCTATINGTVPAGSGVTELFVNWNGSDSVGYFWEHQVVEVVSDAFTVTMPLIGGTGSYNFVDFYDDVNNTWTGIEITATNTTCSYTPPVLTVDAVTGATNTVGNDYDAGAGSTVTISGTSTVPGRSIKLETYACGSNYAKLTNAATTANGSGTYDWSAVVNLFEGWQNINISDGQNWDYVYVTTTSTTNVPTSNFGSISVSGATENTAMASCGYQVWDAGTATTVTVSGTTSSPDGWGEYWIGNQWGNFEITGGSFSFDVTVFDGYNSVYINDSQWNSYQVEINTTNGQFPPQNVAITAPTHGATVAGDGSGNLVVTADTDYDGLGFVPNNVNGYVSYWDTANQVSVYQYFSSDPNAAQWGDLPLTIGAGTASFTIGGLSQTAADIEDMYISVDACGNSGCHGHSITVNQTFASDDYYYKPGQAPVAKPDNSEAVKRRHQRARKAHAAKYAK